VASFTGLPAGALAPVIQRLTLRRSLDERGKDLLDLPRAPLPDAETPAPVRWRHEKDKIVLEPFERLSKETRRALDEEGEHMRELFA
jgi:hypothetical protein